MANPLVSVIMLTYNREAYLPESMGSVLAQSFQDLEFIVIDDGSTDNSKNLIERFSDPRIRYHAFPHTGFASRLRNFALHQASGKYIAFIDSDDFWLPDKLKRQIDSLSQNADLGFTFSNVTEFGDRGVIRNGIYPHLQIDFEGNIFNRYVQNKFVIYPSTILFKKACLDKTGYLSEQFPWTDNDLFHRLAYYFNTLVMVQPAVKIRKHPGNTSSKLGLIMADEMIHTIQALDKEGKISNSVYRKMMGHYYYLKGMLQLKSQDRSSARKTFLASAKFNPLKTKAWFRYIFS